MKNLTVTWEDDKGEEISILTEHDFINGINIDGVQESTVTIKNAVRNSTFTCTLYPYVDQPYSTEVHLLVNSSGKLLGVSIIFSLLFAVLTC